MRQRIEIDVTYTQMVHGDRRTYKGNVVAWEGTEPVCYGPANAPGAFELSDLPRVWDILVAQLGTTDIQLVITPHHERGSEDDGLDLSHETQARDRAEQAAYTKSLGKLTR